MRLPKSDENRRDFQKDSEPPSTERRGPRAGSRDTVSTEEELRSRVAAGEGGQRQGGVLTLRSCPRGLSRRRLSGARELGEQDLELLHDLQPNGNDSIRQQIHRKRRQALGTVRVLT